MNIFNIITGKDHVNDNRFPNLKFISRTKRKRCVIILQHYHTKIKGGGVILKNINQTS